MFLPFHAPLPAPCQSPGPARASPSLPRAPQVVCTHPSSYRVDVNGAQQTGLGCLRASDFSVAQKWTEARVWAVNDSAPLTLRPLPALIK